MRGTLVGLIFAGGAVAMLGGCSGAGAPAQELRGGSVQQVAQGQLTTLLLLRTWMAVLYAPTEATKPKERHVEYFGVPPHRDDHCWGTNSDDSTFDIWNYHDGSSTASYTRDGKTQIITAGVPTLGADESHEIGQVIPDAMTLNYRETVYDLTYRPTGWVGEAQMPDNQRLAFDLLRTFVVEDHLKVTLPDEELVMDVHIPTHGVDGIGQQPIADSVVNGTCTAGDESFTFTMTGKRGDWSHLQLTTPDGISGEFNLTDRLAGGGTLKQNGKPLGALHWGADITGKLDLMGASSIDLTPAAAAQAFALDRWVANMNCLGPSPVY